MFTLGSSAGPAAAAGGRHSRQGSRPGNDLKHSREGSSSGDNLLSQAGSGVRAQFPLRLPAVLGMDLAHEFRLWLWGERGTMSCVAPV